MAFTQVLNEFGVEATNERHAVAHKFLIMTPTKDGYEYLRGLMEQTATDQQKKEVGRYGSPVEYSDKVMKEMKNVQKKLGYA